MKRHLPFLLATFGVFTSAFAGTLPSNITSNTVLDFANSPYTLSGPVYLAKGVVLTVKPGVLIQSSGNYSLFINGELQCLGTKDSMVRIENTVLVFNTGSVGYKKASGSGSRFLYTWFAPGQNTSAIRSTKASVFAQNSVFQDVGYAVSAYSDSVNITLRNCKIIGKTNGYSVYNSYKNWHLELLEDTIIEGGYLYMGSTNEVRKCLFLGGTNTYYGLYGQLHTKQALIECNYFKKIYYGINLSSLATGHGRFIIRDNYIDSAYYGVYMAAMGINKNSFSIIGNSFLWCNYAAYILNDVTMPTPTNWAWPDNYWCTADTAKIKNFIYDNRRFAMIPFRIDYSNSLTQPKTPCGPVPPSFVLRAAEPQSKLSFNVYPNPATGAFVISTPDAELRTWSLSDLNGRVLKQGSFYGEQRIETGSFKAGLYLLEVQSRNGLRSSRKVLVQ